MPPDLPRFVPTLTEVVEVGEVSAATASSEPSQSPPLIVAGAPGTSVAPAVPADLRDERRIADDLAEQIAHRVLQRVDALLAERLSEALRQVVAQHTQTLLPAVREEIVMAVHATVAEALADEFLQPDGTAST